jgi:hypothetical protein
VESSACLETRELQLQLLTVSSTAPSCVRVAASSSQETSAAARRNCSPSLSDAELVNGDEHGVYRRVKNMVYFAGEAGNTDHTGDVHGHGQEGGQHRRASPHFSFKRVIPVLTGLYLKWTVKNDKNGLFREV